MWGAVGQASGVKYAFKQAYRRSVVMASKYRDRVEAGQSLGSYLRKYADHPDVVVLALPRGGVPVAYEIARTLHAPMDVFLVRKLGVPGQEELAMGAIASGGLRVLNPSVVDALGIPDDVIDAVAAAEQQELDRREREYRGDRPSPEIRGRTVVLVDDGLATGATMRAAVAALRAQNPAKIVVAVPVGAPESCEELEREADEVVCPMTPEPFYAIGLWYEDFAQTSDAEVRDLLANVQTQQHVAAGGQS
jgi:predicted phosphoribosyltransferase